MPPASVALKAGVMRHSAQVDTQVQMKSRARPSVEVRASDPSTRKGSSLIYTVSSKIVKAMWR